MPVIPILPSINTCMSLTTTTSTLTNSSTIKVPEVNTTQLLALAEVCSSVTGNLKRSDQQSMIGYLLEILYNFNIFVVVLICTGADSISVPNVVMNSLVSATKVITNDIIPNPIAASHNPITLPSIPLPIASIGIPVMNVKTDNDGYAKLDGKSTNLELESIETEDEKLLGTKKSDELMPVEDDTIIEMAHKIEENIAETDVEVADVADPIGITSGITKSDDSLTIEQPLDKNDVLNVANDQLNASEPMECASVNSMASPKHTNDVIMAESISVSWTIELRDFVETIVFFFVFNYRHHPLEVCKSKVQIHHSLQTRICMIL